MNRFVIVDGLPYLYANGKAHAVRWNDDGFTVGDAVKKAVIPCPVYTDREIKAKCAVLDSIGETATKQKTTKGKKKNTSEQAVEE